MWIFGKEKKKKWSETTQIAEVNGHTLAPIFEYVVTVEIEMKKEQ